MGEYTGNVQHVSQNTEQSSYLGNEGFSIDEQQQREENICVETIKSAKNDKRRNVIFANINFTSRRKTKVVRQSFISACVINYSRFDCDTKIFDGRFTSTFGGLGIHTQLKLLTLLFRKLGIYEKKKKNYKDFKNIFTLNK